MRYIAAAVSDIGKRESNQDSLCVKIAIRNDKQNIAMGIMCDGMGGLTKGELASATLIRAFESWFHQGLPASQGSFTLEEVAIAWKRIIEQSSMRLREYGKKHELRLGTTFSGIFLLGDEYLVMQIGDSRIYEVSNGNVVQLTEDQTLAMKEYELGHLTKEEAQVDPRRSILLQCVGVTERIRPEIQYGHISQNGTIVLCSDGLYHTVGSQTLATCIGSKRMERISDLRNCCEELIGIAKDNQERDNISLALIQII